MEEREKRYEDTLAACIALPVLAIVVQLLAYRCKEMIKLSSSDL